MIYFNDMTLTVGKIVSTSYEKEARKSRIEIKDLFLTLIQNIICNFFSRSFFSFSLVSLDTLTYKVANRLIFFIFFRFFFNEGNESQAYHTEATDSKRTYKNQYCTQLSM